VADTRRPCPCCGHLVFDLADGWPGSFALCPVCFWEDDAVQFRWPDVEGGANVVSLLDAQRNFRDFGACEQSSRKHVRPPRADEPVDPAWRPIDPAVDVFEEWEVPQRPWPEDPVQLCW
jgi:hypothetical protein